jgi:hypothetical protein
VLHGLAHGDAVGVLLLQPFGLEVAHQRARAQEGGLVALAFLFGKAHHLDVKGRRRPARCSSRTQAMGTKMPRRPSYLPPLRTVS